MINQFNEREIPEQSIFPGSDPKLYTSCDVISIFKKLNWKTKPKFFNPSPLSSFLPTISVAVLLIFQVDRSKFKGNSMDLHMWIWQLIYLWTLAFCRRLADQPEEAWCAFCRWTVVTGVMPWSRNSVQNVF